METKERQRGPHAIDPLRAIYGRVTAPVIHRWCGGLHAGLVIKGLYLQWAIRRHLYGVGKQILDAGCGPEAQLAALLAARFPTHRFEAWSLYVDAERVRARDRRLKLHNLVTHEADLLTLDAVARYDVIYSIDVLEHIMDYRTALGRLARSLRQGGTALLHVPSLYEQDGDHSHDRDMDWSRYPSPRPGDEHVREGFDPHALRDELSRVGLRPVDWRWTFGPVTSRVKRLYSSAERRGIPGVGVMLLPLVLLATMSEMLIPPKCGGGIWIEAVKT